MQQRPTLPRPGNCELPPCLKPSVSCVCNLLSVFVLPKFSLFTRVICRVAGKLASGDCRASTQPLLRGGVCHTGVWLNTSQRAGACASLQITRDKMEKPQGYKAPRPDRPVPTGSPEVSGDPALDTSGVSALQSTIANRKSKISPATNHSPLATDL